MVKKILVLLDIDGTLMDENYNITSDKIYSLIEICKKKGAVFCLNSNRAMEDLIPIYKKFNLNGFIIGENGSFVFYPENEELINFAKSEEYLRLKKILPEFLENLFDNSKFSFEDTVKVVETGKVSFSENTLFLANKFRKYTFSIHVKDNNQGILNNNIKLSRLVAEKIKELILKEKLSFEVAISDSFANILIFPNYCNKGSTFSKILAERYGKITSIMIGDDYSDEPLMNVVNLIYAVGNAQENLKKKADYVSAQDYTKGVEDILKVKILSIL